MDHDIVNRLDDWEADLLGEYLAAVVPNPDLLCEWGDGRRGEFVRLVAKAVGVRIADTGDAPDVQ